MSKQKRMIYIYEENLALFDGLVSEKKASKFVNDALMLARKRVEKAPEDPNIAYVRERLAGIDSRNRNR